MASNFTVTPTWVHPIEPEFHNIISKSESMKKVYYNVSATSISVFHLVFEGLSDAQFTTVREHYNETSGGYEPFYWNTVPSYIESGNTSIYGRWVEKSFKQKPKAKSWNCEIDFERDNS